MRRYIIPIATRYASVIVQFAVVAVVTNALDRDDAGRYFVVMGFVLATYFVAGAGLPDGLVRFVPALAAANQTQQSGSLLRTGFKYSIATIPFGALTCGALVAAYSGFDITALLAAAWWASYGTIFVSAQVVVAAGKSNLGTAMFYSAANAGQTVIAIPLIVALGLNDLDSVLLATVAGTSVPAVGCLVIAFLHQGLVSETREPLLEPWRQGATIASGRVVQACLIWCPVWIASLTLGPSEAALIGLASRLMSAVGAVIAAVRFSIRPKLARDAVLGNWKGIERHSSQIAFFTTLLALVAIVIAYLAGDTLVNLVFGSSYRGTGVLLALMLIGTVGESLGGPVDEVLRMAGNASEVLAMQIVALAVGFGAQLLAVRLGGELALVTTYGFMFVVLYQAFILRLWWLRRIVILPKLRKADPE